VASHLLDVTAFLHGQRSLSAANAAGLPAGNPTTAPDLADVRGQHRAKRALEIAAAGAHSLLMVGPPGAGKTMLAMRLPGVLPAMTDNEALEAAAIQSLNGCFSPQQWRTRPFRAPHHTASGVALVGGGSHPRPGEISLAHHGVLFLDELPEFDRGVLEVLREPLESGSIVISRAARQAQFPARFQLVAAMNPCPCGYHGDASGRCRCSPERTHQYRHRLSGPLLDRVDMHIEVPALPRSELVRRQPDSAETSAAVRERVDRARAIAMARTGSPTAHCRVRRCNGTAAYQRKVGNYWSRRSRAWGSVRVPTTDCSRSRAPSLIWRKTKRSKQRTLPRLHSYAASIEQWVPNEDLQTPKTKKRPCGRFFGATSKATYLPLDTM